MERQGNELTMERNLTYQLIVASVLVVAGLTLLFLGFMFPPQGEIHDSVLIAYGEVSTFAGSLVGVDYHYRYRSWIRARADRKADKRADNENEDLDR